MAYIKNRFPNILYVVHLQILYFMKIEEIINIFIINYPGVSFWLAAASVSKPYGLYEFPSSSGGSATERRRRKSAPQGWRRS